MFRWIRSLIVVTITVVAALSSLLGTAAAAQMDVVAKSNVVSTVDSTSPQPTPAPGTIVPAPTCSDKTLLSDAIDPAHAAHDRFVLSSDQEFFNSGLEWYIGQYGDVTAALSDAFVVVYDPSTCQYVIYNTDDPNPIGLKIIYTSTRTGISYNQYEAVGAASTIPPSLMDSIFGQPQTWELMSTGPINLMTGGRV